MQYYELSNEEEITDTINKLRSNLGDLRQIVIPNDRESTMSGRQILTLYRRFEPAAKIEGDEALIDQFVSKLNERANGGSS